MGSFLADQSIRLLREHWGSIFREGRRETGATELAQEFYAMVNAEVANTTDQPVEITAKDGIPLKITNNIGGTSLAIDGGGLSFDGGDVHFGGQTFDFSGSDIGFDADDFRVTAPEMTFDGIARFPEGAEFGGLAVDGPMELPEPDDMELPTGDTMGDLLRRALTMRLTYLGRVVGGSGSSYQVQIFPKGSGDEAIEVIARVPEGAADETVEAGTWLPAVHRTIELSDGYTVVDRGFEFVPVRASGSGTNVFLGRVTGGGGNTYAVQLYGHGSGHGPTHEVSATVPQIDPEESIPAGTWIAAVHRFVDPETGEVTYEFQPPVWM
jgi:hypothetical protein